MWWRELQAMAAEFRAEFGSEPRSTIDETAQVAPSATLDTTPGPIKIGARTRVCEGAYVQGPVEIGDDCMIGNLALVRGPARLGNFVRIGFATEVKGSIIEDRVTIGPQCFVADSKVERNAYLGAQVRTSNHRLDGERIRVMRDGKPVDTGLEKLGCLIGAGASLGIQVIVLPGRVIAPHSSFAPRITVEKNLPTGRYRLAQQVENF